MNNSKEFLQEEKCDKMQAQNGDTAKKVLEHQEEQELSPTIDKNESIEMKGEKNELEDLQKLPKENEDAKLCIPDVVQQEPINDGTENTTSFNIKNWQEQELFPSINENESKGENNELEELQKLPKENEDAKLCIPDVVQQEPINDGTENTTSFNVQNWQEIDAKYTRIKNEYHRLNRELEKCLASDKLCNDQMQSVKESCAALQLTNDQQKYENQETFNIQEIEELEKHLNEQKKTVKASMTAMIQQQSIMKKLQHQSNLLTSLKLCQGIETKIQELLELDKPQEPKPTP
ncbi:uncharacterized protein LOC113374782 [Ctenocephalides felis]|uniref:uncharacterized protein LOC113374782 n=1 Tax=Ctenocephalides felis TaxID=7515 RepID=UPI000E6E5A84|nr:uncharacterized protein LOC113374782 [Ctenocephalides felis]